jgi:hypothetical protein
MINTSRKGFITAQGVILLSTKVKPNLTVGVVGLHFMTPSQVAIFVVINLH